MKQQKKQRADLQAIRRYAIEYQAKNGTTQLGVIMFKYRKDALRSYSKNPSIRYGIGPERVVRLIVSWVPTERKPKKAQKGKR